MIPICSNGNLYESKKGESLMLIAKRFDSPLSSLKKHNPHIQSVDHIISGQIVCIPTVGIKFPCCSILNPVDNININAEGVALVRKIWIPYRESTSISIHAFELPIPSYLGDFDSFEGFAQIPYIISWRFRLFPTSSSVDNLIWAGRFNYISAFLTPYTKVQVRLSNSKTDKLGPVILHNTLNHCRKN